MFTRLRVVLILSMTAGLALQPVVHADSEEQNPQSQAQPTPPPKSPPPPLFPKHRRGLYKDAQGVEVIDATPQSPPLGTDDPGVPDKGEYEINLSTHADLSKDGQSFDLLFIDANYGILPKIAGHELPTQVKFETPLAAVRGPGGDPFTVGVGASTFGLKFNFLHNERRGFSLSVYPQVEFGMPGAKGVEKGLAEPGQTIILPLLLSKEFHYVTFVANGAVHKPVRDPERETTGTIGVGFGRAIRRKLAAMVELRSESTLDFGRDRLVVLNGGLIHGVRKIIVYGQVGRSLFSDDGFSHMYVGGGIKLLIEGKAKPASAQR